MLLHFLKSHLKAFLLAFCMLVGHALAGELITHRAYVIDASGQKSLTQIATETATPYTGVLSRGYTEAAIWIKLDIVPPVGARANDDIVLRIRPVYLDEISLFDPLDDRGHKRTVGDTLPMRANEFTSLSHTFVVPAGEQPRTIWLRVKTTSTCLVNVEALSREEMVSNELKLNFAYFSALALVGMLALLVLAMWINHRESLYAFFVVRQIYYFFYTAALFGLHRLVFPNANADLTYSWIVIIATAVSFLFEYRFLQEYSPPKWVKAVLWGIMGWSLSTFVLLATGHVMTALRANISLNVVCLLALLSLSITFMDAKKIEARTDKVLLSKRIVVGYYASVILAMVFGLLPYFGVMDGTEFAVNALFVYSLFSGLSMTALMQVRANKQRALQSEFEKRLLLSEQSVALEKSRREEQTHLFHMLMHELKTPLSIIDMALRAQNDQKTTSDYVSRAVVNMKDILDRCVKADKLTEGNVDVHLSKVNINQHIRDLIADKPSANVHFVATEQLHVTTDSQFLTVMLSNLLDNAERYGDAREVIEIVAKQKQNDVAENGVSVTVSNRPSVASWPDADKVFQKYYRSRGAEAQSGTGLGLYLVRTLARLVGGDCQYVPSDKYITFEIWLPS